MAVDYRDEDPFTDTDHTLSQIAEAIRHKKYGKDVREAIAQGFELLYKKIEELENMDDGSEAAESLSKQIANLNAKVDRIVLGVDHEAIRQVVNQILSERGM